MAVLFGRLVVSTDDSGVKFLLMIFEITKISILKTYPKKILYTLFPKK